MKKFLAMLMIVAMTLCCLTSCMFLRTKKDKQNAVLPVPDSGDNGVQTGEYVRGTVEGTKWSSKWIGLSFDCGSEYIMSTDDELKEIMKQASEAFDWSNPKYSELVNVYEMMAISPLGSNVIVMTEKLALSNITMDQYITAFKAQCISMYGDSLVIGEKSTYNLAGVEFTRLDSEVSYNGISMNQVYLFKKVDNRMIAMTFTEIQDGDFEAMAAKFTAYNG